MCYVSVVLAVTHDMRLIIHFLRPYQEERDEDGVRVLSCVKLCEIIKANHRTLNITMLFPSLTKNRNFIVTDPLTL